MKAPVLLTLLIGGTASGGPLGKVVGGMREAAKEDKKDGGGGVDSPPRYEDRSFAESEVGVRPVFGVVAEGAGAPLAVSLEARLGVTAIRDSGPAIDAGLRVRFGGFAVIGELTSFFEEEDTGGDVIRLDLWRVGGALRVIADDRTSLWIDLALAGVHTQPELSMVGVAAAGRLEHVVSERFGVSASVGTVALEHDVTAMELRAAGRYRCLTFGYRLVDFSVGPPLHGPEVGLAFSI